MEQKDIEQRARLIGGVLVIALGVLAIIGQLNVVADNVEAWLWVILLAVAAVAFVWLYLTSREAWALLVAYIAGAIAVIVLVAAIANVEGDALPPLVLALIGAPFVVAWWRNRSEWGLLIPAYVLFAIAAAFVFNVFETENFVVTYVMWIIAAPFLLAAAISRQWPFLIPGGIMFVIGAAFVVGSGEAVGTAVNVFVALVLIAVGAFLLYRAFIERRQP
ncbi:MAG: hypothetical protein Kow00120_08820 [Anaerolineae bacterium]